jgi:hypothetical protein
MRLPNWLKSASSLAEEAEETRENERQLNRQRDRVKASAISLVAVPGKYTQQAEYREEEAITADITTATQDIAELERIFKLKSDELLEIEVDTKNLLKREHAESKSAADGKIKALQKESTVGALDRRFKRIDMSFLSLCNWSETNQCPVPLFGVFTIENAYCKVRAEIRKRDKNKGEAQTYEFSWADPTLACVRQWFQKGFLTQKAQPAFEGGVWRTTVEAEAKFTGAIPDEVRQVIKREKLNFEHIYIIAEVPDWELKIVPAGDPLVIGEKHGIYWFLEKFDTTSAEQFVVENYTNKKK